MRATELPHNYGGPIAQATDKGVGGAAWNYFDIRSHPLHPSLVLYTLQAADKGIGGAAWNYFDIRSQQLLSRLIEKFRAVPQPIIAAVHVSCS